MNPVFAVYFNRKPVNPVMILLPPVITQFIFDPETNYYNANHTNRKAYYIDKGIGPVFPEITNGDLQQIFYHEKFRVGFSNVCKLIIKYTISNSNL